MAAWHKVAWLVNSKTPRKQFPNLTVHFILSCSITIPLLIPTLGLPGRRRSSSLGDMPVSPREGALAAADPLVSLEEGETGGTGRFAEKAWSWAS